MSSDREILIISGTNRPGSNTSRIAQVLRRHYTVAGHRADVFGLEQLPPEAFAPTVYASKPPELVAIQQRVLDAAGLHIVTPEYNGSFPGILKHFIDLLKFPESFANKPVAFTGLANGVFGALRAVEQLQMIFAYRNAHVFPDRLFIPKVGTALAADGSVVDADIDARLARQARGFAPFAQKICDGQQS